MIKSDTQVDTSSRSSEEIQIESLKRENARLNDELMHMASDVQMLKDTIVKLAMIQVGVSL